jgi:predicted O-methyltransferase YrrM
MEFTTDWFSNHITVWRKYLKYYAGKPNIKALEVGSYEGRSAVWLLDNILTHPSSHMTCVDNFSVNGSEKVHQRFLRNMSKFKSKYNLLKGVSRDMLKLPKITKERYDIIYIDADHTSKNVLEDAVLCFPLLNHGGIMIFDDYTDNKEHDNNCPKPAINAFMAAYANEIRVLHIGWQVILKKRSKPLRHKLCFSEYSREPPQASSMRRY